MVSAIFGDKREQTYSSGSDDHQQGSKTRGDIVGHIVDTGCPTAKVLVTLRAVAYHGVERIHHLVGEHPRRAANGKPEQWCRHTVAQVLGKGLKGCCPHLLCRQFRGVASHDACHLPAAVFQGAVEGDEYGTHLTDKRGASQTIEHHDDVETDSKIYTCQRKETADEPSTEKHHDNEDDGHQCAFQLAMLPMVEPMLAKGNHLAKPHYGVWQPLRVSQHEVEQPAGKERKGVSHRSVFGISFSCLYAGAHGGQVCRIVLP